MRRNKRLRGGRIAKLAQRAAYRHFFLLIPMTPVKLRKRGLRRQPRQQVVAACVTDGKGDLPETGRVWERLRQPLTQLLQQC
ncbi:hypothetical protein GGER_35840 [Serratia rubidaea]